jgi:hypothetical protein
MPGGGPAARAGLAGRAGRDRDRTGQPRPARGAPEHTQPVRADNGGHQQGVLISCTPGLMSCGGPPRTHTSGAGDLRIRQAISARHQRHERISQARVGLGCWTAACSRPPGHALVVSRAGNRGMLGDDALLMCRRRNYGVPRTRATRRLPSSSSALEPHTGSFCFQAAAGGSLFGAV